MSVKSTEEFHVSSLLRGVAHGWALLTKAERKRMRLLWVMIVVDGMFKTFALAAIVPFVLIVVDPDRFFSHPRLKQVIEWLGVGEPTELLVVAGILLIGVIFLKNAFGWVTMRTTFYFSASCEARLSEKMMGRVLHAPFAWTIQHNSQRLRIIIKDHVRNWAGPFQRSMVRIVNDLVFTVTMMAVLIYASPGAGAIVSILAIVMGLLIICGIRPVMLRLAETIRVTRIEATILGAQAISGVKDIKMTGTEDYFLHAFTKKVKRSADSASRAMLWQQIPRIIIETLSYGALISLIVIALSSGISPNELAAVGSLYAVAALRLMPTISHVVSSFGAILAILPSIEEIRRLLSETKKTWAPESSEDGQFNAWREFTGSELGYTYAASKLSALHDVSLHIEFGKHYGLAGPSGSGKSTLIDVLSGLLSPQHGAIKIDGETLNSEQLQSWRRHIGYVSQSPFMLDATLKENIAFGVVDTAIDERRLANAIKHSNLTSVVERLPDGLETQIGESAMRLSGGERQRVAIARALYQEVRLLIFDEATSALDNLSERDIRNTITGLIGKVTVVLIAHRMSSIMDCDRIYVLNQGRLVGEGSYDELLKSCPLFSQLAAAAAILESASLEADALN